MSLGPVLAALPASLAAAVVRDGARTVLAVEAVDRLDTATDAFGAVDGIAGGFWAGALPYEVGAQVERVRTRTGPDANRAVGPGFLRFAVRADITPSGAVTVHGSGPARRAVERALDDPRPVPPPAPSSPWATSLDRDGYETRVRVVRELIRAGECYQVNLTRRLTGPPMDATALWHAVESGNPAPHAMFWRAPDQPTVVSASPERFLRLDGRHVESRPIKGTAARVGPLRTSEKDHAENVMIVDLARNDLGRICVPGSVRVPELCGVERHPGLVHLVSTVRGERRADVGLGALLHATFPPASVTGAPKPRVLQAVEDLEPVARGIYCGAVGWYDADRQRADLAVAIRTLVCTPEHTTLGVGAGITVDSDPATEWAETELKAARLLHLAGAPRGREAGRVPAAAGRP
jgi:para-aminobenzoate synthetase component 1